MHIAFMLSRFAVGEHGPIDFGKWREGRALTGTELATVHVVRGLAERGHTVHLYCVDAVQEGAAWEGVQVIRQQVPTAHSYDACVAISDPRLLHGLSGFRVNWSHAATFFGDPADVDAHVFVSPTQRNHVVRETPLLAQAHVGFIPNPIDVAHFVPAVKRPNSMAWASSPDRGLHHMLLMWSRIRALVPDAHLRIFYRTTQFLEQHNTANGVVGDRARYITSALQVLGSDGRNGIQVMGPVTHTQFTAALCETRVLPYTFDPPGPMTEAFCIALLDACAAGCVPICSDLDALGDNFAGIAQIVPGLPGKNVVSWIAAIVAALQDDNTRRAERVQWARQFDYPRIAAVWERFLLLRSTTVLPYSMKKFTCT